MLIIAGEMRFFSFLLILMLYTDVHLTQCSQKNSNFKIVFWSMNMKRVRPSLDDAKVRFVAVAQLFPGKPPFFTLLGCTASW